MRSLVGFRRRVPLGSWLPRRARRRATTLVATLGLLACIASCTSNPPGPPGDPGREAAVPESPFSSKRAWRHLEHLSDLGPRPTGSRGAERARRYLADQLGRSGLTVFEVQTGGEPRLVHLMATLPGESSDEILLVAHYDTRAFETFEFVGANAAASGPAIVLELARVLSREPQLYTIRFLLLDGDGGVDANGERTLAGSRAVAAHLAAEGVLERVRLAVFFDRVGDADLRIARDLRSNRVYRDVFWDSARTLQQADAFPASAGFESPVAGHHAFLEQGLRRVVALVDTRYGGDEPPGLFAYTADDQPRRCSQESLGAVGSVSVEGLDRIARRLAKIDRFAQAPLAFDPALSAARDPAGPASRQVEEPARP